MKFSDLKEVPEDVRFPFLARTRESGRRDIRLLHYNRHIFKKYKYKYFIGVLAIPFSYERTNYIFFNVTTLDAKPKEIMIFNTYNLDLATELYFNKLKYAYETLTIAKPDPENTNIIHFPKLEKDVAKEKEPLQYIFENYGDRVDFDSLELPNWKDEPNYHNWRLAAHRDGFIRSSFILNLMADIFIQLGIDPARRIKKEVIKLNNRCRKDYVPEVKQEPTSTPVNNVPDFDPDKDYSNPITNKLKGVNHPGFKVYN
jgi:hypothetical protein